MINQNQYFVTIAVQQKEGEIAFYEIKKPIEPLAIKEKTFELFEVISKLGKTDDVILYPIMFLRTSYTPKSAVERLIITTARKYYNPSEKVVAVAVEYGLNSIFSRKGLEYLQNHISKNRSAYFVGTFYKKFGDSSCAIQVCIMTEKTWDEYCGSIGEESKVNPETLALAH
jgi:hypothetical protein